MENKPLSEYTRAELIETINSLKKRKKFGLVWEDKPEKVAIDCEQKLPVIKEVAEKAINKAGNSEPTNIIIEGDNYHAFSVLNYTHAGKIDVIYVDPPYNTGSNTWVYNNKIIDDNDSYKHSKWLSMMRKRLSLAKSLLSDTGIICVTIDDYELFTLGLLMDEIFGENNKIGVIVVENNPRGRTSNAFYATSHEYYLIYAKNITRAQIFNLELTDEQKAAFKFSDEISPYRTLPLRKSGAASRRKDRPTQFYPIYVNPENLEGSLDKKEGWDEVWPIDESGDERVWRLGTVKTSSFLKDGTIIIKRNNSGKYSFSVKDRIKDGRKPKTVWISPDYDASSHGATLLLNMFGKKVFDYPKSINAVRDWLFTVVSGKKNAIILDFFAGSGTTGQAVIELNENDGGHRQFILCTNNENGIAEKVTYQRIKYVISGYGSGQKKIEGKPANVRYFKTDFVEKDETLDKLRRKLSPACEDMIRIREGSFEKVIDDDMLKVFRNSRGLTAVIFDRFELARHIAKIEELETDSPIHLYVFSYSKHDRLDELDGKLKHTYESQPIPEGVLEIYKRIFARKGGRQ